MDNDGNPQSSFIRGIFNYCDRWCERCTMTTRCRVYAAEQSEPPIDDMSIEEFCQHLRGILKPTIDALTDSAQTIDVNDAEAAERVWVHPWAELENDDLLRAARRYASDVQAWWDEAGRVALGDDVAADEATPQVTVSDALQNIAWYQLQIAVKLTRALAALVRVAEGDLEAQRDCDGSAKVALIAIDRSLMAWQLLAQQSGDAPGHEEAIAMAAALVHLRTEAERRFPAARSFMRPGFDTPLPEQMN